MSLTQRSTNLITTLLAVAAIQLASTATAQVVETNGTVDAVTVYRGQALVTRLVDVPGPAGLHEVVVGNLPDKVAPGSIFAESADGVTVRSVRYRVRPVMHDVRDEVRQLDQDIAELNKKLKANARYQMLVEHSHQYLGKLEQFTAPTADLELSRGVLNAETLERLTLFAFGQRRTLADQELNLADERANLQQQLNLLQRRRSELTGGSARTAREAVAFVDVQGDSGGRMRLKYIVNDASWTPSYNVRAGQNRDQVVVEYNASIQQMSGEDWSNVAMTLSTATPSLVAKSPTLTPLSVRLTSIGQTQQQVFHGKAAYQQAQQQLQQKRAQMDVNYNSIPDLEQNTQQLAEVQISDFWTQADNAQDDRKLNDVAVELQMLDLASRGNLGHQARSESDTEESVSVVYALPGRTTLPSRSDRQLIQIVSQPMTANFYKVATPVLTDYVYEEASIVNDSAGVLLAGPSSAFFDGQFVGHGWLPTVAAGESFTAGFGIDSTLRASRELMRRRESIQGGNRVVTFTYALAIDNFGDQPVDVRLFDRLPNVSGSDIKVTLDPNVPTLSDDPTYRKTQKGDGILRWDVNIPAASFGNQATTLEYSFTLEYDKEMIVTGLTNPNG